MTKQETDIMIEELTSIRPLLNKLESKARTYNNQGIDPKLDGHILYELELLQEKLTTTLYHFYLGDINRDFRSGKITFDQRQELILSKSGRATFGNEAPFFSFGYRVSEFIDELGDIDETRMFFNNL